MKNWALTNWLDWFERQREGRAQKATLEPCKADQRGSPPKAEGQDQEWKLCPGYMPTYSGAYILWRRWRKVGRRRQELEKHKELGDKPVCEELFLPPPLPLKFPKRHSWSYIYLVCSQALGPHLPGTKRSSPTPSSPTRGRAGKPVWEPQEARILLESGKSLNGQAPELDPYSQIPSMKGTCRQPVYKHSGC